MATLMVIYLTLAAALAMSGFTYGIFQSSDNTAEVGVVGTYVPAAVGLGATYVLCAAASGNSFAGFIQLYNSGTAATVATLLNFVYVGAVVTVPLSGSCKVAPESSLYLVIYSLPYLVATGVQYTGYVSTANGAEVLLSGAFD